MSSRLTEGQIDDLLDNVIDTYNPNYWKDGEKLVCCPVHGESNPSMGISIEKQVCHCFSCGFAGDFAKLLLYSRPEDFGFKQETPEHIKKTEFRGYRKARDFLKDRYELEYYEIGDKSKKIKRYEQSRNIYLQEDRVKRTELPLYKLAPFMSGKETYQYFFDRGFDKEDMKKYMIGRDLDNRTITIPVFYGDNKLAGIIGRYISKKRKKNQRFKIYNEFNRSSILYPLNIAHPVNDTVILVEGQFDAIRMHKAGHINTFALMTNTLSKDQADWLCNNCSTVIWVGDNDERGLIAREKARKLLKNKVWFMTVDYPDHGKDVCDWSDDEIEKILASAKSVSRRKIRRFD